MEVLCPGESARLESEDVALVVKDRAHLSVGSAARRLRLCQMIQHRLDRSC